ncbi:centrosomal protein of 44 kDa isoform X1 [Peromyscus californicus insignis]|uniref:centrosomal protein of 44 kDa isoform X1 n=1 Tax=Peromyscus californicus insignis TaxID=564181 RepID=UPI0022A80711|nr:centrosomal protein of 44 kDa isoform X1 [Peromyscus californicus insignis]XP_052608272.1 centrosomal protein of 44 kDa isoform X1 [Peromyscus californicus insignis]XP_052608273.1 centrosomal protein of 44 kDa isoform X1 [Peromyscus californicus insignis]XP_052608274.1 centrosomal protein of 44 kDa isoform X1 [Peromyscus californicus insignis]XP_052608275.1 centrosomal protein of 44 kDa isoform X1 [Peromyscus californicus insignis]
MATGDLKRSLRKLEQVLRLLNYPNEVDYVGLMKGDTAASLPIISYSLTSYSPYISELLMESNIDLISKNDVRFTDTVYKLLRDQFDYKPILTKKQFIQSGFAEWKIQIVCDILNCVMKKHKELTGSDKTSSCPRKKSIPERPEPCSSSENATPGEAVGIDITGRFMTSGKYFFMLVSVQKKAVVIRHLYTEDNIDLPERTVSSTEVSEGCDESEEMTSQIMIHDEQASEVKAQLKDLCDNPELTALHIALAECQDKLKRLTCVEKRLQYLEAATKGKVMVDEKAWNNLLSRVTLLETEMLLSKKNECVELNAASEDNDSDSVVDAMPVDKKYSVGAPARTYRSSGYSSTLSPESTPRGSTVNYCGLKDFSEETTLQKMERMKKMFEETAELLKCSSH